MKQQRTSSLAAILAVSWIACTAMAGDLPNRIPFELGEAEFATGDSITISSVRGSEDTIKVGSTISVEGFYTLSSKPEADLALFVTTSEPVPSRTEAEQIVRIKKGSGSFRLIKKMDVEGYPHLSFYPVGGGSGFGGIYFGEGEWVLHRKGFSYVDHAAKSERSSKATQASTSSISGPNRAFLEYLGEPVAPPAKLKRAYTQEGLRKAVQTAAKQADVSIKKIQIDDTEFPFLVGVSCEEGDMAKLERQIKEMADYEYHGSVGTHTCYTMNITPLRITPGEAQERVSRRTTLRMQMFYHRICTLRE